MNYTVSRRLWRVFTVLVLAAAGALCWFLAREAGATDPLKSPREFMRRVSMTNQDGTQLPPDALEGGVSWINTRSPIHLEDLRGKIVLLDFWTYCCINCHHILPDLEKLEQKYAKQLVVLGVHSAKFDAEKDTDNIRQKVAEYRIRHPVVNDANQVLWRKFGVNSWPTLVLIDARGRYLGALSGEGHYDVLDRAIGKLVEDHRKRNELDETPLYFEPEMDRPHDPPLLYPGKITADKASKKLFITDTGHNRIVVTDLEGKHLETIGSGDTGFTDGSFAQATFNRPQGTCLVGDKLYLADTENHAIREIDLASKQVSTVAGTGKQAPFRARGGPAKESPISSPWDVLPDPRNPRMLFIAMAGPHQIWTLDLAAGKVAAWAGSGREDIIDGSRAAAAFAQPSGLATDGKWLFVADSEVSGIRAVSLTTDRVETIVGINLFGFGDVDGRGDNVRLQHCLGLAYGGGALFVADSYNNKIKVCGPPTRSVTTLVGSRQGGLDDDPPLFDEPGGLSLIDGTLYVADTNNHAVRVIDVASKSVKTLVLEGVEAPTPAKQPPSFPNAIAIDLKELAFAPTSSVRVKVAIEPPAGFKISPDAPMPYLVQASSGSDGLEAAATLSPTGSKVEPPSLSWEFDVPLNRESKPGDTLNLRVSASAFLCKASICQIHSYVWTVPLKFEQGRASEVTLQANPQPSNATR